MNPPIQPTLIKLLLLFSVVVSNNRARFVVAHPEPLLHQQAECRDHLDNCTDMVHPYLKDPQYMFPTSLSNVNDMCKMWSQFVDCIRRYISQCFEENRRVLFHKSVENSIDTVHAICSSKVYQNEYLNKATCFKQISMDHCGANYRQLIDTVSNPNANDEHICCAYAQFKQCVNRPLLDECGRKAKNLMDHSMSFLISRCNHYSYQIKTDCPKPPPIYSKSVDNLDSNPEDTGNKVDQDQLDLNGVYTESRDSSSVNFTKPDSGDNNSMPADQIVYESEQSNQADRATENILEADVSTPSPEDGGNSFKDSPNSVQTNSDHDNQMMMVHMSTTTTSPITDEPIDPINAEQSQSAMAANNNIDSIETGESEQDMIVYTLKPESQISASGAYKTNVAQSPIIIALMLHSIRLGTVLWLFQWFSF